MQIRVKRANKNQDWDKDEAKLCDFVAILQLSLILTNASNIVSSITGIESSSVSFITKILMALLFVRALPVIVKRITPKVLVVVFVALFVTCFNMLFFPETMKWFVDTTITYYTMCLTSFVVCSTIRSFTQLKVTLLKIARVSAILSMVILGMSFSGMLVTSTSSYNMGYGYACLPSLLCLIYTFVETGKWYDLLWAICLFGTIFILGSRGPLMGIALFVIYFCGRFLVREKKYLELILMLLVIVLLLSFYESCFILIAELMDVLGINSRSVRLLAYNLFSDTGRSELYSVLINEIELNPLAIRGINAEYLSISKYAHNIIIEILYDFGIIIGGVFLLFIITKIIKTLVLKRVDDKNLIVWIFAFSCIPQLMVSSSLWINQNFWIWLAFII